MAHDDDPQKMADMARWLNAASSELGLDKALIETNQSALLRLINTIAHGPSRPGAPLTAFLVGYAAASTHCEPEGLVEKLEKLAENWQ